MNNLLERMGIRMPQYQNIPTDLGNGFRFIIIPSSYWRRVFNYPYFVGDRVRFRIEAIEVKNERGHIPRPVHYVHEFFRDREKECSIIEGSKDFEGNIIDGEGDVKYSISVLPSNGGRVIMTARVINKDRWFFGCAGLVVGAVVTFLVTVAAAIVSGAFEVDKFWHFINPFWK